ncbi:MAG TPA: hypothetical protein VMG12_14545 [Polyangiaceae bacterium]|nr:hypothetical protein [Polyangiaceae bacterium]
MGQHTVHTRYRCPCGAGAVTLTTTAFGAGGSRKLHTQLVQCAGCKPHYTFSVAQAADGSQLAFAEDTRTHEKQPLIAWPEKEVEPQRHKATKGE